MRVEDVPQDWIMLFQRVYREQRRAIYEPTVADDPTCFRHALAAVAPMIAAAEREACAKVADAFPARTHGALATAPYAAAEQAADEIAAAIRARGEVGG